MSTRTSDTPNHARRPPRDALLGVWLALALGVPAHARATPAPPRETAHAATLAPLPTTATIVPSFTPDHLGSQAALTIAVRYTGGLAGVPAPVRTSVLQLPAGLALEIPKLVSCSPARLLALGAAGCPRESEIGRGGALAEALAGTLHITENVALRVFLGAPDNAGPTFEILARGYTPLDERMVFTGTVLPASPPYGEKLDLTIPPIATMPDEPNASIVALSLTIGARERPRVHDENTVLIPPSCPTGGFPFAAEFTYADGSSGSSTTSSPCPPAGHAGRPHAPAARTPHVRAATDHRADAARTITLNENGRLHLTSKHGFTLNEQGTATGTAAGTIYVHLTAVSTSRMTVEVNIYPRGGSISGYGTGTYRRASGAANFSGTMSISRGSGSYSHVDGAGLSFSGTIEESNHDAITVHVTGRVSD
jgi:hypothetical protein